MQLHVLAPRTVPFTRRVISDTLIASNMEQRLARNLVFFVHAFEFEHIEPDPTATALTDIDYQAADLQLGQFVKTSGAFHEASLPQALPGITW
jgi:hypothetical protein